MEHDNKPIVETQISKSKDGKYLLHITKITDIKPVGYYAKVLGDEVSGTPQISDFCGVMESTGQ